MMWCINIKWEVENLMFLNSISWKWRHRIQRETGEKEYSGFYLKDLTPKAQCDLFTVDVIL